MYAEGFTAAEKKKITVALDKLLDISKDGVLFLGDMLQEGGNDYPVRAMGVDCLEVSRWQDTALVIEGILHAVS